MARHGREARAVSRLASALLRLPFEANEEPRAAWTGSGCPCEFCDLARLVEGIVRDRTAPGFAWCVMGALTPRETPRAFVVRWGDA